MLNPQRNQPWAFACAVVLSSALCLVVFWPGLSGDFIFDDYQSIVENGDIQVSQISASELLKAARAYQGGPFGRPLTTISFAVNYRLTGLDPFYFKLTNLVIHLANFLLILALARSLICCVKPEQRKNWHNWLALAAALIWAIHPLQVSTVLYAVQRMEMLAATFTIMALLAYIKGRDNQIRGRPGTWSWLILAGFFTFLAVLAKETGALVPVFALCIELTALQFQAFRKKTSLVLKSIFSFLILAGIGLFIFIVAPEYATAERYFGRDYSWYERLLSQLRALPLYISWIVYPSPDRMVFFYDHFIPSRGLLSPPSTLLGGIFLAALLAVAAVYRKTWPLTSLGILWFFVAHLLTSNIFSLELVFEHRNYLAIFGIILSIAVFGHSIATKRLQSFMVAGAVVLILGLGSITAQRSVEWGDAMRLTQHLVAINPESQRAQTDLAFLYREMAQGDHGSPFYAVAISTLETAATLPRSSPIPEQALILLSAEAGFEPHPDWWEGLLAKLAQEPVSAPYRTAVQGLVRNRFRGVAISDERLSKVHSILMIREGVPPRIHAEFGFYFAEITQSSDQAYLAFGRALELLAPDAEGQQGLLNSVKRSGHAELAKELAERYSIQL